MIARIPLWLLPLALAAGAASAVPAPAPDAAPGETAPPPAGGDASAMVEEGLPYQWVEVAAGVYAALQPEGNRFNDSNSVVIVGEDDVVVVDTQNYPTSNRALIDQIRRLTDKPVRYLVNTHWHGDHTQGNAVYREAFPELEILGHPTLVEDIPGRARPQLEEQMGTYRAAIADAEERLARGVDRAGEELTAEAKERLGGQIVSARDRLAEMEAVEFVTPSRTIDSRFILEQGERLIDLRPYRAHTRGDLVVFLPREKILVTGDLLDDLPYGGHGYPKEWIAALRALEELDFEILIPGHGRLRQGKSHLRLVREMFETIVRRAEEAGGEERSLEELQEALDLTRFRAALAGDDPIANQAFDQFVPPTVERAWLEARGRIED